MLNDGTEFLECLTHVAIKDKFVAIFLSASECSPEQREKIKKSNMWNWQYNIPKRPFQNENTELGQLSSNQRCG